MPTTRATELAQVGSLVTADPSTSTVTVGGTLISATGTAAAPAIVPTGDTNTGIFFPAADTIAASTNNTERLRIDSSGRLDVNGNVNLASTTFLSWGTSVAVNAIQGSSTNNFVRFITNSTERLRIDSSGNVGIGLTPTARNNTRLQIVDGIGFPATQVASSDPNTLDDYEEGTWTPTLTNVTVGNGIFTQNQYIKIGRQVYVSFNFVFGSTTTVASGSVINIDGLPFAAESNGVGSAYLFDSGTGGYTLPAVLPSSTALNFRIARGAAIGTDQITDSLPFTWAVDDRINFAGVYRT